MLDKVCFYLGLHPEVYPLIPQPSFLALYINIWVYSAKSYLQTEDIIFLAHLGSILLNRNIHLNTGNQGLYVYSFAFQELTSLRCTQPSVTLSFHSHGPKVYYDYAFSNQNV